MAGYRQELTVRLSLTTDALPLLLPLKQPLVYRLALARAVVLTRLVQGILVLLSSGEVPSRTRRLSMAGVSRLGAILRV